MKKRKPIIIKIITRDKDIFRKPMYRYTITGLNGQNIYSYLPEINLSSLPTGSYHIKAACSTRNGDWTADYDILTLTVLPPWYKSGWFILSCTPFYLHQCHSHFHPDIAQQRNQAKVGNERT